MAYWSWADLHEVDVAGEGGLAPWFGGASIIPHCRSIAVISSSRSQIGTSTATVTESAASMNVCKRLCRSRLFALVGMMRPAMRVAVFSFGSATRRLGSMKSSPAFEARSLVRKLAQRNEVHAGDHELDRQVPFNSSASPERSSLEV